MAGRYIKHFLGAYKYAITQTFAIPTIDDAEKSKYTSDNDNSDNENNYEETQVETNETLNENKIDEILGNPNVEDYESIFALGEKAG